LKDEMKKNIFIFPIVFIFLATFVLGFYLLRKSEVLEVWTEEDYQEQKMDDENLKSKEKARILFVGDMMFDRWIRQVSSSKGFNFILSDVENLLQSQDLVVGNLEGPITNNQSISLRSEFGSRENYIFTFPIETAQNIFKKNIRLVNIGNNHILNFGKSGLDETEKYLTKAVVDFFGDTGYAQKRFILKNINGIKIAFINYNQFVKNSEDNFFNDLKEAKKLNPDFTIAYTHWGTEYVNAPNKNIVNLAHRFVDGGVDLVIGSHPHVVQTKEEYKGKMIYYSLGNFVFDQYFNLETQKGLTISVDLKLPDKEISIQEYPVGLKSDGKTVLNAE